MEFQHKNKCNQGSKDSTKAQNTIGNNKHWTEANKAAKIQPMYGPKLTKFPDKQSGQSWMYYQNIGNIIVWISQSLATT